MCVCVCACVCVCVREKERERERNIVCVSVCVRVFRVHGVGFTVGAGSPGESLGTDTPLRRGLIF